MGGIGNCCLDCTCLPIGEVPVTAVPGSTAVTSDWTQIPTGPTCCWIKYFDYDAATTLITHKTVYHVRLDSSVDYQYISNVHGLVMTGTTEYKFERWKRLKVSATPVPDPVTGHDVSVTWSKVCGAVCDGGPPTDYYVLEYTQRLAVVLTEEHKNWSAQRLVNAATQPATVPRVCTSYNDGKWFGGTAGGTYVTNSSTVPPQQDIWQTQGGPPLYSATIQIRRYTLFEAIPDTPTSFIISESEVIPICKQTPCMVGDPLDGYGFAHGVYPDTEGLCAFIWSIVTNAALTPCPVSGVPFGPANRIKNQNGDDASGFFAVENLLVQPCTPSLLGGLHCIYKEYSNLVYDAVCDTIPAGTFYFTPPMELLIGAGSSSLFLFDFGFDSSDLLEDFIS